MSLFMGHVRIKILIFLSTEDKYKITNSEKQQKVLKESLTRKCSNTTQNYPV